jgi:hypothetical protein
MAALSSAPLCPQSHPYLYRYERSLRPSIASTDRTQSAGLHSLRALKVSRFAAEFLSVRRVSFHRAGVVVVVAAAVALAGCGNTSDNPVSNGNRLSAEARLTAINASMTIALTANPGSLPQLTQDYIGEVQTSETLLGAAEAKQKLTDTANQLATSCSSCAQSLNTAAAQIGP